MIDNRWQHINKNTVKNRVNFENKEIEKKISN